MHITCNAAKNPIFGKEITDSVANDVDLESRKSRLTFITGPNSSDPDRIFNQVLEFSSLEDGEGRFGTELKRTKAIFMATSANKSRDSG